MTVKLSIPASLLIAGSVGRQTIGSLGSSEDSTTGSLKKPTFSERHPKAVRSVTVIGYLFCVSLAAILLSAYYVVLWKPATKDTHKNNSSVNTTSLPCRRPVTYLPSENGGIHYIQQYHRLHPSKYTHSAYRVILRAPSGAPQPLAPAIPEPSRLVSLPSPNDFESFQQENSDNNSSSSSLQRNNSDPSGLAPALNDSNISSTTETTPKFTLKEPHHQRQTESEQDVADSTLVPKPSTPSLNSIIIQKLLRDNKSVIQHQKIDK